VDKCETFVKQFYREKEEMANDDKFIKSSGNIFEDLGLKDAKEMLEKSEILSKIDNIVLGLDISLSSIASHLGMTNIEVEHLLKGINLRLFSRNRLRGLLKKLEDFSVQL